MDQNASRFEAITRLQDLSTTTVCERYLSSSPHQHLSNFKRNGTKIVSSDIVPKATWSLGDMGLPSNAI